MSIDFDLHDPYGVSAYQVSASLREQGFGVLAHTDLQASLKEKR